MTRLRDVYGPGFTQAEYLRALHAGHETGWWNDNGVPAPWPDDFDETDNERTPDTTKINSPEPGQPPF
jgi:hypothetical protein